MDTDADPNLTAIQVHVPECTRSAFRDTDFHLHDCQIEPSGRLDINGTACLRICRTPVHPIWAKMALRRGVRIGTPMCMRHYNRKIYFNVTVFYYKFFLSLASLNLKVKKEKLPISSSFPCVQGALQDLHSESLVAF